MSFSSYISQEKIKEYPIEVLLEGYWKGKMFLELNSNNPFSKLYITIDKQCDKIFEEICRRTNET